MRSFTEWDEVDHVIWGGAQTPYYIIGFRRIPTLIDKPLVLKGDTLEVGDTIVYIGGHKTSAGFSELSSGSTSAVSIQRDVCGDERHQICHLGYG